MTSFDDQFAEFAAPYLSEHFGQTVSRYPLGVVADSVSVADVWFHEKDATRDKSRGDEIVRTATLLVSDSVTLDSRDAWLINSEEWQVKAIGNTEGGRQRVTLQKNDRETHSKSGGGLR